MPELQSDAELAEFFDHCACKGEMLDFSPEELEKVERFIEDWRIAPGQKLLEPGCGAGRLSQMLSRQLGPEGQLLACDLSPQMLDHARRRGMPPNVRLHQASVLELDIPPASLDRILCFCVFPHFTRPEAVLRRFAQWLKPESGRLWINHLEGRESLNRFHREAARSVAEHELPDRQAMESLLSRTGFHLLRYENKPAHYILEAAPEYSTE